MPDLFSDRWDTETALSVRGRACMETRGCRREVVDWDSPTDGVLGIRAFWSEMGMMLTGIVWLGVWCE